jgi:predicted nucleotidyltransferase
MDPQRVEEIARRHGVLLLVQFGSSVTGRMHPGSDVDLAQLPRFSDDDAVFSTS